MSLEVEENVVVEVEAMVGADVGYIVGKKVGYSVDGEKVGPFDGNSVDGERVGPLDGYLVDGDRDGLFEGSKDVSTFGMVILVGSHVHPQSLNPMSIALAYFVVSVELKASMAVVKYSVLIPSTNDK